MGCGTGTSRKVIHNRINETGVPEIDQISRRIQDIKYDLDSQMHRLRKNCIKLSRVSGTGVFDKFSVKNCVKAIVWTVSASCNGEIRNEKILYSKRRPFVKIRVEGLNEVSLGAYMAWVEFVESIKQIREKFRFISCLIKEIQQAADGLMESAKQYLLQKRIKPVQSVYALKTVKANLDGLQRIRKQKENMKNQLINIVEEFRDLNKIENSVERDAEFGRKAFEEGIFEPEQIVKRFGEAPFTIDSILPTRFASSSVVPSNQISFRSS